MNKKNVVLNIVIIISSLISIFIINIDPIIHLNGGKEEKIKWQDTYKEQGAYVSYLGIKLDKQVKIYGIVDTQKVGSYIITYSVNYFGSEIKINRLVKVVDLDAPSIKLKGNNPAYVCPNKTYEEEGYEAIDEYDGILTDKVEIQNEKDKIIYKVIDSSNNASSIDRNIKYEDKESPKLKLNGSSNIVIYQNSVYKEYGVNVTDNCDSNLKSKVKINGSVNTKKVGTYTIVYSVSDAASNKSEVKRIVKVIKKPDVKGASIYLTFDDGPSASITPKVLQILKEEGIKATFFVINHSNSLNYLIKQAYDDGHTVAIHSYTHNYKKIYASEENYFNDLKLMSDKIYNITGKRTKIVRFPGGSSNTVSRFNPGIMTRLSQRLEEQGYTYFDWNVGSGDAGDATNKSQVYNNVIKGLGNKNNIVLLHDFENNYKTLNALRDIIKYGKENGYVFLPITENTIPIHHKINN